MGVFGYGELLTQIASKGYVIVGLDRLSVPNYPKEALRFMDALSWAKAGCLKAEMLKKGLAASPDLDRTTVMAQSAGNHIVGQALADNCMYAKAFVMIDCLNDAMIKVAGLVCKSNPNTNKAAYRRHLADTSGLFIEGVLENKAESLAMLEDPSHFAVDVVLEHDRKGKQYIEAKCTNDPRPPAEVLV